MTTAMTTISDIFTIQDAVHQGDFVLRLTEGLQAGKRRQTLQQYVVTPQLVQSFRQSLALNGSADFAGFDLQVLGTEPGTSGHKKARDGGGFGVNNALSLEQILVAKGGLEPPMYIDDEGVG